MEAQLVRVNILKIIIKDLLKMEKFTALMEKNSNLFLDLTLDFPKEIPTNQDFIIISLAPIWLIVPYLEYIFHKRYLDKKNVKGIIITSSTSIITKKYSWNRFDKNLYGKLMFWEKD